MACPDDNALVGFVHRSTPAAALAEVEAHLAGCDVCRAVVADLARELAPMPEQQPTTVGLRTNRPAALLEAGARVGRYVVVRRLGAGGMGVVYEATDPDLVRSVALKLVRWDLADGGLGDGRARMMREAQTMARLSHPNVVSLYDVGTHDGQVFLAMEFVPGRTLGQWLASKPGRAQVLDVFRQAGAGLAAAHDAGLVHRDFKPANVLVSDDGRVRVTDFGLARAAETPLPVTSGALPRVGLESITRTGAVAGTPAYMAPELLAGGLADPRSDQFAFCVALYEALAGTRPFEGDTLAELHASVLAELIRPPVVEGALTPDVRRVVLRGLRAEPRERYPSMRALLADLETKPPRPRWPLAVAAAAVLLVGLAVGSALRREPTRVEVTTQTNRDAVAASGDALAASRDAMPTSRDAVAASGDALPSVRDAVPTNRDAVASGGAVLRVRDAAPTNRDAVPTNRDAVPTNRDAVAVSGDALPSVRDAVPTNRDAVAPSGGAVPKVRDAAPTNRDVVAPTSRDAAPTSRDGVAPTSRDAAPTSRDVVAPSRDAAPTVRDAVSLRVPETPGHPPPPRSSEMKPPPVAPRERPGPTRATPKKRTGDGFLSLHVAPWAEAAVDGKALSSANMMDYVVPLAVGRHEVVLKHPQFGTRTDVIFIEPGRTLERRINLR